MSSRSYSFSSESASEVSSDIDDLAMQRMRAPKPEARGAQQVEALDADGAGETRPRQTLGARQGSGGDASVLDKQQFEQQMTASGHFAILSDEMVAEVFEWLDIESFGRAAQTCHRLARVAEDVHVLGNKASRGKWILPGTIGKQSSEFYKDSFKSFKKRQREAERTRKQNLLESEKSRTKRLVKRVFQVLFCFPMEIASVVIIWQALIRTPLKLDGVYDPSWGSILWPLVLPGLQFTFGNFLFSGIMNAFAYTSISEYDFTDGRGICKPMTFHALFTWPVEKSMAPFATIMNLPTGFSLILIVIKLVYLEGASGFPYIVCAMPIVVQSLIVCGGLWTCKFIDSDSKVEGFFFGMLMFLWSIAVLFISVKLDGFSNLSWYETFIPLLLMKCWFMFGYLMAPVFSCLPCCEDCMEDNSYWNRHGEACEYCWFSTPLAVVFCVPLIIFEWLLATNLMLDRFDTWGVIFVPIYCMAGVVTVFWIGMRISTC